MFEHKLQRRYVLAEKEGLPPFILAEVVGIEYGRDINKKVHGGDPRFENEPYCDFNTEAGEIQTGDRIVSREELEAKPEWAEALRRWEAGDDLLYAEWHRLDAIKAYEQDLRESHSIMGETEKRLAEEARAGGSLLPA